MREETLDTFAAVAIGALDGAEEAQRREHERARRSVPAVFIDITQIKYSHTHPNNT